MNGNVISLLADPVSERDACNRKYVDNSITNLNLSKQLFIEIN